MNFECPRERSDVVMFIQIAVPLSKLSRTSAVYWKLKSAMPKKVFENMIFTLL